MPKVSINIIKEWFKNQSKPPQEQFWAWLDSFWHKDEPIPQSAVENLVTTLQKKADLVNGVVPEDQLPFSVVTSEVITLGAVSIVDDQITLAIHSSGANKVRVKGKTITRTFPNSWNFTPIENNGVKVIRGYAVRNEDDFFISEGEELPEFTLPEIPEDALQLFIITITQAGATVDTGGVGGFKTKAESGWKSLVITSNNPRWITLTSDESMFEITEQNGAAPLISGLLTKGGKWIYPGKMYGILNASGSDVKIERNNLIPPSDPYQLANYLTFAIGTDVAVKPGEYFWFKIKGQELVVLKFAPDVDLTPYALQTALNAEEYNRALQDFIEENARIAADLLKLDKPTSPNNTSDRFITADGGTTAKSNYQRNKQFFVTLPATVSEDWKGCMVFFTISGTLTIPTNLSADFTFNGIIDNGVSLTPAITNPMTWLGTAPAAIVGVAIFTIVRRDGTNNFQILGI